MTETQTMQAHDVRRVAVESESDPRTVRAYLERRPVRSTSAARIKRALRALDLDLPAELPAELPGGPAGAEMLEHSQPAEGKLVAARPGIRKARAKKGAEHAIGA